MDCNRYRWQRIIQIQLKKQPSGRIDQLKFDSEADMVVVRSAYREALKDAADMSRAVLDDPLLLRELITLAEAD